MFKSHIPSNHKGVEMTQKKKKKTWLRVIVDSILNPNNWLFWVGVILAVACILMFFLIFMWPEKFKLVEFGPWLYISYLSGYTVTKEIGGWVFKKRTLNRPGELIVLLWVLFGTVLWWWVFMDQSRQIPEGLGGTITAVIGLFAAGQSSSAVKNRLSKEKKDPPKTDE